MPGVGERLKQERENRSTTIEEIGSATGIQLGYLQALENGEFETLPGRAFGKLYIRAYAEVLGFDPRPLIDDYDREWHRARAAEQEPERAERTAPRRVGSVLGPWREAKIAERDKAVRVEEEEEPAPTVADVEPEPEQVEVEPVEAVPVEVVPVPVPRRRPILVACLVVGGVMLTGGILVLSMKKDRPEAPRVVESAPEETSATEPIAAPLPAPTAPASPSPSAPKTTPSRLSVTESEVGHRIVSGRIEEPADRFVAGETAWFSTRVLHGRRGDRIRHVWIHEGKVAATVVLGVGASDWRTQSRKRINGTGDWTVEARDEADRVLATAAFTCGP